MVRVELPTNAFFTKELIHRFHIPLGGIIVVTFGKPTDQLLRNIVDMEPGALVERALLNSSKAGDVVADLFGGSGSTLIACERRNRKGRLMEMYQEYTGNQVVLEVDGRSFNDVAQERRKE
jgi:DNA modification methylase